jgi:hypothetical protein
MDIKLINNNTNAELVLSEESLTFVLEEIGWGEVEAAHSTTPYVDTIGSEVTETFFNPRDIEITGWILASNRESMTNRKKILNKLINPKDEIDLIYKSYKLRVKANTSIMWGTRYQENNDNMCKFILRLTAYMPLFILKDEFISVNIMTTPMLTFPLVVTPTEPIVFGVYSDNSLSNMMNEGDVFTGFLITITAIGEVTNPTLNNLDTGEEIRIVKDLLPNDVVKISTMTGNKYVELTRNEVTTNIVGDLTRGSTLFGLNPGLNRFELTADVNETNLQVSIEYVPRYLEVQD